MSMAFPVVAPGRRLLQYPIDQRIIVGEQVYFQVVQGESKGVECRNIPEVTLPVQSDIKQVQIMDKREQSRT